MGDLENITSINNNNINNYITLLIFLINHRKTPLKYSNELVQAGNHDHQKYSTCYSFFKKKPIRREKTKLQATH